MNQFYKTLINLASQLQIEFKVETRKCSTSYATLTKTKDNIIKHLFAGFLFLFFEKRKQFKNKNTVQRTSKEKYKTIYQKSEK